MKPYLFLICLCAHVLGNASPLPSHDIEIPSHDIEIPSRDFVFQEVLTKTPFLRSWASIEYGEMLDLINTLHSSLHALHYGDTRANIFYYSHLKTVSSVYHKHDLIHAFIKSSDFYDEADYTKVIDMLTLRAYSEYLFKDLLSFLFTKYPLDDSKEHWKELLVELANLYKTTDNSNYRTVAVAKKKCFTLLISFITNLPTDTFDSWISIIKHLSDKDRLDIVPETAETFEDIKDITIQLLAYPVLKEDAFAPMQ